jgi:hypothetical protein
MREIFTFYYKSEQNKKIVYGITKCRAVSQEDANSKFYAWALNNDIYILDFDCESEAIEEEREF